MFRIAAIAACVAALIASPAAAQSNPPIGVFDAISSDELVSVFARVGIDARYVQYESSTHFVEVRSGAFAVMIGLRACDGATSASRCKMVQPFALFSGTGLTLAVANQLNLEKFDLANLMLLPDGNALLGLKLLLDGGVTEANLRNNLGLFFSDAAKFLEGVKPGVIALVNYQQPNSATDYRSIAKAIDAMDDASPNALGTDASSVHAVGERLLTPPP